MAIFTATRLIRTSKHIRNMSKQRQVTAGILVIGDELLKGEVRDANSPHITKDLHSLGVKVKKVSIIGDDVEEISNEIKIFAKSYNYVITTGGIGPTHDDVTFEAVANAFNVPLILNSHLQKICERFYKTTDVNHPGMKLAKIPETAKLHFADQSNYPNVSIQNVYMFPGIPELFLKSFKSLCTQLFKCDITFYTKAIYVTLTEDQIAYQLTQLASAFPDVQIGSYPKLFNELYKVKITLESTNEKSLNEVNEKLLAAIPKGAVVTVNE